jgi:phenylalanine-4-hydroxylase
MQTTESQQDFLATVAKKSAGGELRGDYTNMSDHYVVQQNWAAYTEEEHALWRKLYQRQAELLPGRACDEFIQSLETFHAADGIPDFEATSDILEKTTGWRIVAVPGLIPELDFFTHLANRRFPVTVWLRKPEEFDYIVEPDVFHDYYGHVPLLLDPIFAKHIQEYGKGGLKALRVGGKEAIEQLARLYWYTIEFGLIQSPNGIRAYGAGILSSVGELDYCLKPSNSRHIAFNVERCMRTLYKIDTYQETYFVIRDFQQLFDDTAPDFTPIYQRLKQLAPFPANTLLEGEVELIRV